jgi:hypothetical protein
VFPNRSDNTDDVFHVTLTKPSYVVRYKSNDPSILGGDSYKDNIGLGRYFWPWSSSFPTYGAATLVKGSVIAEQQKPSVALLLQMTVSGATGLPRRPKHKITQHILKKFDSTFAANMPDYKIDSAITVFVVPSECFEPFLFQPETTTVDDDTESNNQPDYQLVLEMPDAFVMADDLKKYLNKPRHSYATRASEQPRC